MNEYYDAIIVGTGAAGLYCALNLPKRKKNSDAYKAGGGSVRFVSGTGRYLHAAW